MTTVWGLLFIVFTVYLGYHLEGGHFVSLINPSAFLIVVGGSLGAVFLQTPTPVLKRALRDLAWFFATPRMQDRTTIQQFTVWTKLVRQQGLLSLEEQIEKQTDSLLGKGLTLLILGKRAEELRSILAIDVETEEKKALDSIHVYESLAGYSPTMGILAAVMALIQTMTHLQSPAAMGSGIAVAFVATVYGVAFANLLCLPIAYKLTHLMKQRMRSRELLVDGFLLLSEGEHPEWLRLRLEGFVA